MKPNKWFFFRIAARASLDARPVASLSASTRAASPALAILCTSSCTLVKKLAKDLFFALINLFMHLVFIYLFPRTGQTSYLGYGSPCDPFFSAGFWHEQSRPDRNDHVTIVWDNIRPGAFLIIYQEIRHIFNVILTTSIRFAKHDSFFFFFN